MDYSVKTAVFEGPLDLLLDLIERRKLFVSDVSLSEVTDDFVRYIETHDKFPLDESAEFIVVASTLMLIKSRSLLPSLPLTEEETASMEDLEHRLRLYQKVKDLSAEIKKLFGKNIIFEKQPGSKEVVFFSPDSKTDVDNLSSALMRVLETLPKKEPMPKTTVRRIVTLEEMIENLAERISKGLKMKFSDVYKKEEKINTIVGFLAVLELVKRGILRVSQEARHGEIELETENLKVPNYA
ncbi:segregation/condensation protein A [Candidatus Parcubacteria bacterium]|nr:segregation/condensation protein A [Candidatus Parcubacteria bacterium]